LIVDLAAKGTSTPTSTAPGSAGAALADAAKAACECLAAVFRSPGAAGCVAAATSHRVINDESGETPVGARLTLSLIKLWHAQAVGTPGGTRGPGAAAFATPHTAVASALRNVLAYSASGKRAASEVDLIGVLLKVMEKARVLLAYDLNREKAVRQATTESAFFPPGSSSGREAGAFGFGGEKESVRTACAVRDAIAGLGAPPKPLAMAAEIVLAESVSLIKHLLYCPPDASAAAAAAASELAKQSTESEGTYCKP